jgi:hypothetical protein
MAISDEQGKEIYRLKTALVDVLHAPTLQEARDIAEQALAESERPQQERPNADP